MSNLRKTNVALSNLRNVHVALSNLRNAHVALSNCCLMSLFLLDLMSHVTIAHMILGV